MMILVREIVVWQVCSNTDMTTEEDCIPLRALQEARCSRAEVLVSVASEVEHAVVAHRAHAFDIPTVLPTI